MTIRILRGKVEHEGVPYMAGTSQCTITDMDDAEGQRLIDLGYAEKTPDPPKTAALQIFPDSPEKIRNKISELREKLSAAEKEHEALLDDDLQDVAGVMKKIEAANGRVSALRLLIQKQQAKLSRAEENEAIEKEKAAVKQLEKATATHKLEAEKILNGLLSDVAALETKVAALGELRERVRSNFYAVAPGMYLKRDCPFLTGLSFPLIWKDATDSIKAYVNNDLSRLDAVAARTPAELKSFFNSKRYKSEDELSAEARERERERQKEPAVIHCEPREVHKWTNPEKPTTIGESDPASHYGETHSYPGAPSQREHFTIPPGALEAALR